MSEQRTPPAYDLLDDHSRPVHDPIPATSTAARPARGRAVGPDGTAILAGITREALIAVPAAQYASIAWAGDRWLVGHAPTHSIVATLDALQGQLRQGPCLDVLREQQVVTVPDTSTDRRWPIFAARAAELAIGSTLSVPLTVDRECWGVLTLYATLPRAFTSDDEHAGAVFADRAAMALPSATERDRPRATVGEDTVGQADTAAVGGNDIGAVAAVDALLRDRAPNATAVTMGRVAPAARFRRRAGGPDRPSPLGPTVTHGLRVTRDRIGEAIVVRVSGVVDLHTVTDLATALRAGYAATRPPAPLVIDLTGIRFFSVSGLALLATAGQHCREQRLTLRVVATQRCVLRPLRLTGLDILFDIAPTLAAATRPRPHWTTRLHLHGNRSSTPPTGQE